MPNILSLFAHYATITQAIIQETIAQLPSDDTIGLALLQKPFPPEQNSIPLDSYFLYLSQVETLSNAEHHMLAQIWSKRFKTILSNEQYPVGFVAFFLLQMLPIDAPAVYAGFLYYLFQQGITADALIQSNILHHIAINYCDTAENLSKIYDILQQAFDDKALKAWISVLDETSANIPRLALTLTGKKGEFFPTSATEKPITLILTTTQENLNQLLQHFGLPFLRTILLEYQHILSCIQQNEKTILKAWLTEQIHTTHFNALMEGAVSYSYYKTVLSFAQPESIKTWIQAYPQYFWDVIADIRLILDPQTIITFADTVPISPRVIAINSAKNYAMFLDASIAQNKLYERIFTVLCKCPELQSEEDLETTIRHLTNIPHLEPHIKEAACQLTNHMGTYIESVSDVELCINYIEFCDESRRLRHQAELLSKCGVITPFAQDKWAQTSFLIKTALLKQPQNMGMALQACLEAVTNTEGEHQQNIQKRMLLESLLHIKEEEILKIIISALEKQDASKSYLFKTLGTDDIFIIQLWCNVPALQVMWSMLTVEERHTALTIQDQYGDMILHRRCCDHASFKTIWNTLTSKERYIALTVKNRHGNTMLYQACSYTESFQALWGMLTFEERQDTLTIKDRYGETLLQHACRYPSAFKCLWGMLTPEAQHDALTIKDRYGETILYRISRDPTWFQALWGTLTPEEQHAALTVKNQDGETILHQAFDYPESFQAIWRTLTAEERYATLTVQSQSGDMVLYRICCRDPELFQALWGTLTPEEQHAVLTIQNQRGNTILYQACVYRASFPALWGALTPEEQHTVLTVQNQVGDTILHRICIDPILFQALWSTLTTEERCTALTVRNKAGYTILHQAFEYSKSFKIIWCTLTAEERRAALKIKGDYDETILWRIVQDPALFQSLWDTLTAEERDIALTVKNKDGYTVLHRAFEYPELFQTIWGTLTAEERHAALTVKNGVGNTILDQACKYPKAFQTILGTLTAEERHTVDQLTISTYKP